MIIQLTELIPMKTALGPGWAIMLETTGHDYFWTIALDNGAIVTLPQERIRIANSYTHGRGITDDRMRDIIAPKEKPMAGLVNCNGCGVAPGELHGFGCDVERCPRCGLQMFSCGHDAIERRMPWTGEWPGFAQCRELGWYARPVPGRGWMPCAATDDGATPDLNRLFGTCRWDPVVQRWVRHDRR